MNNLSTITGILSVAIELTGPEDPLDDGPGETLGEISQWTGVVGTVAGCFGYGVDDTCIVQTEVTTMSFANGMYFDPLMAGGVGLALGGAGEIMPYVQDWLNQREN